MNRAGRWIIRVLASLGLLLLLVTVIPPASYGGFLAGPWSDAGGGVLVILGGDVEQDGSLGESTFWRCYFAAGIWRESGFQRLVISADPVAAHSMEGYLEWRGIPHDAITLEQASFSTRQNAVNTARLLRGEPRVVLLTSDFHMWRARRAFEKAGLHVIPRWCPDLLKRSSDWQDRWRLFLELMREFAKIGYYRAHGWV